MHHFSVILSHDPSKGPYETGAWNALQQMDLPVSCIIGQGVNAFNAALLAQNDFQHYVGFWQNDLINELMIFRDELVEKNIGLKTVGLNDDIQKACLSLLNDENSKLSVFKEKLSNYIDEDQIRHSGIVLGLIAYDLDTLEKKHFLIDDVPKGGLIDMLLLSFLFPEANLAEKNTNPISYLDFIKDQAEQVLIFDEPSLKLRKKLKAEKLDLKSLKPSIFITPCSRFTPIQVKEQMQTGAMDCLKAFGCLSGKKYFFDLSHQYSLFNQFCRTFGQSFDHPEITEKFATLIGINLNDFQNEIIHYVNDTIKKTMFSKSSSIPQSVIEICGQKMQIEKRQIYTLDSFIHSLITKLESTVEEQLSTINTTRFYAFFKKYDADHDRCLLETKDLILLYAIMTTANFHIEKYHLIKIRNLLLPEDILAILGFAYLNLMIKSL